MNKTIKLLCILFSLFWIIWIWQAWFDFIISDIQLTNGWDTVALNSTPSLNITISNIWDTQATFSWGTIQWFLKCYLISNWQLVDIWESPISSIDINPWATLIARDFTLSETLALTERTVNIRCIVNSSNSNQFVWWSETNINNNTKDREFFVEKVWRFDQSLEQSVASIRTHLDASEPKSNLWWWDTIKNFIFNMISKIIVPIMVLAGIIVTILWGYKMLTKSKPEELKNWFLLLVHGIVGIIIILSAKYIWNVLFSEIFVSGDIKTLNSIQITTIAYQRIAYPFIKIIIYLSLWILFFILAAKSISIITDSNGIKKAWTIIWWTAISILVIIWAKQLVEAIYWSQNEVLNESAQNLAEVGTAILANKEIPLLYTIINRGVWIVALVVLILILVQTFNILINPDKAENRQKLWKSLIRIFVGILIIWIWYLLTNALIIN